MINLDQLQALVEQHPAFDHCPTSLQNQANGDAWLYIILPYSGTIAIDLESRVYWVNDELPYPCADDLALIAEAMYIVERLIKSM